MLGGDATRKRSFWKSRRKAEEGCASSAGESAGGYCGAEDGGVGLRRYARRSHGLILITLYGIDFHDPEFRRS